MGFRRRGSRKLGKIPIDATKNIWQVNDNVASGTVNVEIFAKAVPPASIDETVAANIANVEQGAMLKGFLIDVRIYNKTGDAAQAKVVACIRKNEGGRLPVPPTLAEMNALGAVNWKNKIFWCGQLAPDGSGGFPMFVPALRVPKRFHVMKALDQWEICIANNSAGTINLCGFAVYKWYR